MSIELESTRLQITAALNALSMYRMDPSEISEEYEVNESNEQELIAALQVLNKYKRKNVPALDDDLNKRGKTSFTFLLLCTTSYHRQLLALSF